MLKGTQIYLRTVEQEDVSLLLQWENNPENWKVSGTEVPFTEDEMQHFVQHHFPIQVTGQLRFMICLIETNEPIGTIDLFEANFKHRFAGVGILLGNTLYRQNGIASESLALLIDFATNNLLLDNLHCSIHADNVPSIALFKKLGFQQIGVRKEWYIHDAIKIDELLFQLCLRK